MSAERLLTTLQFYLWLASAPVPEPVAVPASTAPPALVEKLPEIRWKKSERKVVAEVVDYDFTFSDPEEEDALAKYYPRVPQKPWRAYASQRQSRQMDRYRARPLRWSEEKVWQKDGDCLRASAPLHRRRQCAYDARQARPGAQRSAEVQSKEIHLLSKEYHLHYGEEREKVMYGCLTQPVLSACPAVQWPLGLALLDVMEESQVKVGEISFNAALGVLADAGAEPSHALRLLRRMARSQVQPSAGTLKPAAACCETGGALLPSLRLLQDMSGCVLQLLEEVF
ncbi:unnamed protein product [Effrenium voratum]|nr:unnamed protein product [Effrenium voratum]